MKQLRLALFFSLVERYFSVLLAFGSSMALARLLTPQEIGDYSITLAAIGIAQVLRDFGVGSYLIQKAELDEDTVRSAFGMALLIGVSLFAVVFSVAPWVGDFYRSERLAVLMRVVALNFLILPFCTISLSLLRRDMRFRALMGVNLTAAVCATAITVGGAWADWGPVCMAIGSVANNVITGFGAWWARGRKRFMRPALTAWRPIARFGAQSVSAGIVTSVAMDINDLVVGRVLGTAPVAISSRAQGLMNLFHRDFMAAIRGAMFPAFAQTHREGGDVDARHTAAVIRITVLAWPFYGFLALHAHDVLRLLFGPQWDAAAPLVPVFCLAGAVVCTANLVLSLLTAIGRNDVATMAELVFQPLRALLIVAAALHFQSLLACAWAYCLSFCLQPAWLYHLKHRCLKTDMKALGSGLVRSAAVALLTLLGPWLLSLAMADQAGIVRLGVNAAVTITAWIVTLHLLRHPLAADLDLPGRWQALDLGRRLANKSHL